MAAAERTFPGAGNPGAENLLERLSTQAHSVAERQASSKSGREGVPWRRDTDFPPASMRTTGSPQLGSRSRNQRDCQPHPSRVRIVKSRTGEEFYREKRVLECASLGSAIRQVGWLRSQTRLGKGGPRSPLAYLFTRLATADRHHAERLRPAPTPIRPSKAEPKSQAAAGMGTAANCVT